MTKSVIPTLSGAKGRDLCGLGGAKNALCRCAPAPRSLADVRDDMVRGAR